MKKSKYFKLWELLPKEVYQNEFTGWELLDPRLIDTIDAVREIMGEPLICNNWKAGGSRNNCGYRTADSAVGARKSAHKEGKAVDLICAKLTANEMRKKLSDEGHRLPHAVRVEQSVNWLHIDTRAVPGSRMYFFMP